MKKILFVVPQLFGGGIERALLEVVNNVNPKKYEISIISLTSVAEKYEKPFAEGIGAFFQDLSHRHHLLLGDGGTPAITPGHDGFSFQQQSFGLGLYGQDFFRAEADNE